MFGPATEVKEIEIAPDGNQTSVCVPFLHHECLLDQLSNVRLLFYHPEFIIDCNFDQGGCEWVQDKADDMDWSVAYHDDGNRVIH